LKEDEKAVRRWKRETGDRRKEERETETGGRKMKMSTRSYFLSDV
jgi:hypothetical protein